MSEISTEEKVTTKVQSDNPISSVTSQPNPQPGQDHRSSGNFSTEDAPHGTRQIQWFITENDNFQNITFDVKEDVKLWFDPIVFRGVRNGQVTEYKSNRQFYIADPSGAGGKTFIVQAWPYPNNSLLNKR